MHQKTSFRGVAKNTGREPPVGAVFAVCLDAFPKRRNPENLILVEAKLRFFAISASLGGTSKGKQRSFKIQGKRACKMR